MQTKGVTRLKIFAVGSKHRVVSVGAVDELVGVSVGDIVTITKPHYLNTMLHVASNPKYRRDVVLHTKQLRPLGNTIFTDEEYEELLV
jgi:hypothetical protein